MSTSTRKRKHPQKRTSQAPSIPQTYPALYIQAYEADIIRGSRARDAARSLEIRGQGSALIPWGRPRDPTPVKSIKGIGIELIDQDASFDGTGPGYHFDDGNGEEIWVDRYDARLLLDSLPPQSTRTQIQLPPSPSGWSDLPSDTEGTFFFSPSEADDYHREKRRRTMERDRESRLQALRDTDQDDDDSPDGDLWGGSDEEPDDRQKTLMHRTATHILQSPNPALLEMRILANHGADTRFAFLRGRWKNAWEGLKAEILAQKKEKLGSGGDGLGGLTGYGESDDDEDSSIVDKDVEHKPLESGDGEDVKAARRIRAKEWAAKRRGLLSNNT